MSGQVELGYWQQVMISTQIVASIALTAYFVYLGKKVAADALANGILIYIF